MALKQDENGFLVGTPVEAIKRLSGNMRKIKEDVAQIKQLLKLSSSEKVKNNRATKSTESKPKQERVNESRLRDSRGRFTSQSDSQQQEQQRQENQVNRNRRESERRLTDEINEVVNRRRNSQERANQNQDADSNNQSEQQRQKTERKRDANGRFISENNNNVIESKSRKRNAKGQFEGNGSAEEKSFLSRSFDSLGSKISEDIQLGTGGLEDVDPTVKAFQEVAEPLSRGYQFLTGNKEEKRDKKYFGWLGKIWKSVKKTEDNTEESNGRNSNGESFLGSLLSAKAIVAVFTTVLAAIFSPIGLAIGAAGVAAWGLFTKSGNKFFSNLTDWTSRNVFEPVGNAFESVKTEAIKKWDNAVSKFSAMFEGMGKKWDELIAGGKALLDKFIVNPAKAAKNHVTKRHEKAVNATTNAIENSVNTVEKGVKTVKSEHEKIVNSATNTIESGVNTAEGVKNFVYDKLSRLGSLSSKYEGKVSSANKDNIGHAYGKYQFNSVTGGLKRFFQDNPKYAKQFEGIAPDSKAFYAKWREIAKTDPKGFEEAQDRSAANLWYAPAKEHADKLGFNTANKGVQEAIFSGSIQHGGIKKVLSRVAKNNNLKSMSPEQQVKAFYEERRKYVAQNLTGKDLANQYRRYASEEKDALKLAKITSNQSNEAVVSPSLTPLQKPAQTNTAKAISPVFKPIAQAQTVITAMPAIPSVLPKTTAIAEAPALTMPIASDARKAEKTLVIAPEIGQDLPDPFLAHIVAPYMRNAKV